MALPVLLLLIPLLAIVPFVCLCRVASRRRGCRDGAPLPLSPWAIHVIGHLHHLAGALPHRAMRDLARRATARSCCSASASSPSSSPSSADAAREVMRARDLNFATRSMSRTVRLAFPSGTEGIIFAPYGEEWRQMRKVCTRRRPVASSAPWRQPPPRGVNLSELITVYAADSAVRTIIGSSFKDRGTFLTLLERMVKMVAKMSLPDLYPSSRLAMLVSRMPGRMKRQRQELVSFIDNIVREHEESRAAGNGGKEDLLDVLLRIRREGDLQVPITTDNIKSVVGDMLGTGSETVATVLQWIMAELMRNPRVMQKVQDEVRCTLAGQRQVTEDYLSNLHYMHLVIKETLRLHPPAPLLFPRECRSECQVLGFTVPKDAMVLVNAWAISRDPKHWDMPEEFVPERFENSKIDFKGTDFEYTPFGAGRRMCPGIAFAFVNMELILASLSYHFDWELPL
ncbi:unnamed protein product [Urochloa decumbens]|uniref:Cytochrome P450 n=1 Tax=Urochloa decumbens TaxID=240449 RepID=A0ABC9DI72_9POAL